MVHPAIIARWKRAHCSSHHEAHDHASGGGWGRRHRHRHAEEEIHEASGRHDGMLFGVRRPLRFMAHKLDLTDEQVKTLASILENLKIERAQAAVDHRRTVGAIAEALEAETFDDARAEDGLKLRVDSAERLRAAVLTALKKTHTMLTPEQREKLAYMLRSGLLTI